MHILRIVLFMLDLSPSRGEADIMFRWQLAEAIAAKTDDTFEQDVLARIAFHESNFRPEVAICRVKGGPARGAFQIEPRSTAEARTACGPLEGQAALALARVRESFSVCRKLPRGEQLASYTGGSCTNRGARKASRVRMGAVR